MSKKNRKPNEPNDHSNTMIKTAEPKENICYEYGVFGLDSVDCDILRNLETEEQQNKYLKKRFPEGI